MLLMPLAERVRARVPPVHASGSRCTLGALLEEREGGRECSGTAQRDTTRMDDAVVRQVIGRCQELTSAECEEFLSNGFVVIRSAFDRQIAEEVVEQAWRSLEQDANILRDDRESWKKMPYSEHG